MRRTGGRRPGSRPHGRAAMGRSQVPEEPVVEERDMTALFSDVASFSVISSVLSPPQLAALLREYLTEMVDIIDHLGGTVDKLGGDSIMAYFGAPEVQEDHALRACLAALDQQERLVELRSQWRADRSLPPGLVELYDRWAAEGRPFFNVRIGFCAGPVVFGDMGARSLPDYTIMGQTVNRAARLESVQKTYGTCILTDHNTCERLGDEVEVRRLDVAEMAGEDEPVAFCEILGRRGRLTPARRQMLELFETGHQAYTAYRFGDGLELFEQGAQTAAALGAPSVYIDAFTFDCHVFGGDEEAGELSYGQQIPAYLPSSDFDWPQFWDHYVGCIAKCSAIARACGLSLLLEPRIGEIVSNSDGALALAEAVGDSNFGLIFDVAHLHAQKENLAVSVAKLHRHIKYVDVSDNDGCRNRHLVPGDGLVDWDGLFDSLVLYGVEAPLAVDLEKLNDVQGSFRRTLDFLGKVTTRTNKIKQES